MGFIIRKGGENIHCIDKLDHRSWIGYFVKSKKFAIVLISDILGDDTTFLALDDQCCRE